MDTHEGPSDLEKKEIYKVKNRMNARRNRKRWKESDQEIESIFNDNEKRIKELEQMADRLSRELVSPGQRQATADKKNKRIVYSYGHSSKEVKPRYFGHPI